MNIVADIGNTRIKWGRVDAGRIAEMASLPPDDEAAWTNQLARWSTPTNSVWVIGGVHPPRRACLAGWLRQHGMTVREIDSYRQLPIAVAVEEPQRVGLDRLFNAVAADSVRVGAPAVLVDAGSAVTVDWLDEAGVFRGGAILPGLRLMTQALHDYTAQLPRIEISAPCPWPATSTETAIATGVLHAVEGGIEAIWRQAVAAHPDARLFLTGGDAALLHRTLVAPATVWPEMTLEGIRLTALKDVSDDNR